MKYASSNRKRHENSIFFYFFIVKNFCMDCTNLSKYSINFDFLLLDIIKFVFKQTPISEKLVYSNAYTMFINVGVEVLLVSI